MGMQKHGCVQPRERARVHVWPAAAVDATAPRALAGRFRTLSDAIGRYLRAGSSWQGGQHLDEVGPSKVVLE